ncbi:MAG: glycosyl hydrolase 53 family protein [Bacilli bacterium]|nr:glycosyl hydrolase 53 family protein [Bacilli bacterium]
MKKFNKAGLFLSALFSLSALVGCNNKKEEKKVVTKVDSKTLYVEKVENMKDDFIMAMDASAVISLEQSGVKYYDYDGNETDVLKVLADNGVNYIRVRVWNDPYDNYRRGYGGGNCTIDTALALGYRATHYGMKLLVDFHYSDFWADPDRQSCPKAWKDMEIEDKAEALYNYTKESLNILKNKNVDVGMVQIGNEINGGRLAGNKSWIGTVHHLMANGSKAVREVYPSAKVAVHFTNPEKSNNIMDYAEKLNYYKLDYDVFGVSYYPYWHGTLDNLATVLNQVSDTYGKDTMVLETSYPYNSIDADFTGNIISEESGVPKPYVISVAGQANCIRAITDTMVNKVKRGIGISYWEGTWVPVGTTSYEENEVKWRKYGSGWANKYAANYDKEAPTTQNEGCTWENQAMFDSTGHPLESLKVFNLMRFGNTEVPQYVDGVKDANSICYVDDTTYKLPTTVDLVYNTNQTVAGEVTWDLTNVEGYDYDTYGEFTIEKIQAIGNAEYVVPGTVGEFETNLNLQVMEHNYIENYSFENGKVINPWNLTVNRGTLSSAYIVQVTNENPKTGEYAFHCWTNQANTASFDITQDVTTLTKAGTYKYQLSVLGGTDSSYADLDQLNAYAYVMVNGVINDAYTTKIEITKWGDGYKNWIYSGIEYNGSDTITFGVHIESNEAGFWCDIDDCMFNIVEE